MARRPPKPPRRRRRTLEPDPQGRMHLKAVLGDVEIVQVTATDEGIITLTPTEQETLRVDGAGRVSLGKWLGNNTMFIAEKQPDGSVILTPTQLTALAGMTVKIQGEEHVAPGATL